ncbi:hypothetical protein [Paraburkholderia aromaticivorans]|uniref:hypothetical protein n=1 Tax=Paraburkholderia aromaticivorans TaxID=2026199 RepID=UPI001FCA20EB|nr:hypothetical protein [Paraburkholderia aromaticivorans]
MARGAAHRRAARALVAWLRHHEPTLGVRVAADVDAQALVPATGAPSTVVVGGDPSAPRLAPFERPAVPAALSGGGGDGSHRSTNRAAVFAFIRAPHDLTAIQPPVRCLKARKVAENSRSA